MDDQIDLARAVPFRLGPLTVEPALRQVSTTTVNAETLEPRVMQVLVVLATARGTIVTRDDLIRRCWEGRIVGDDSVNRVISRLRRLAEERGDGGFHIETITKVGYRLIGEVAVLPAAVPFPATRETLGVGTTPPEGADVLALPSSSHRTKHRGLIAIAVIAIAAMGTVGWHALRPVPKPLQSSLRIGEFSPDYSLDGPFPVGERSLTC